MNKSKFYWILIATLASFIAISSLLHLHNSSLVTAKPVQAQKVEVDRLYREGLGYYNSGRYPEALKSYQAALVFCRKIKDRYGEANVLNEIGATHQQIGDFSKALEFFQLARSIRQQINDQEGLGSTLNSLAEVYQQLGQYDLALQESLQSLEIRRNLGDQVLVGDTLTTIGSIYNQLSNYVQALEFYEQALSIAQKEQDQSGEAVLLTNIATVHTQLGQYDKAIKNYQQSLLILRGLGDDPINEASVLHNMGFNYSRSGQYLQAINVYQQALAIRHKIGFKEGEAATLNNLGFAYSQLGENFKALAVLEQALPIFQEVGDRMTEGNTLDSLGTVYRNLGNHVKSRHYYYQALALFKAIGQRLGERTTLSNLGDLYRQQKQPTSAIIFYKQSVEVSEKIRKEIKSLTREQQESYTKTVEDTYRKLADLLLYQGRLLEAQEALELLKIEEIYSINQNTRAALKSSGIDYTDIEKEIIKEHGSLVGLGQELYACNSKPGTCLDNHKEKLYDQRDKLEEQLQKVLDDAQNEASNRIEDTAIQGRKDFEKSFEAIVNAEPGTLLVYPFITDKKIWLLWASAGGIRSSTEVPNVGRDQVLKAVLMYRDLISNPPDPAKARQLQQSGQQLYRWLIEPLEPALTSKTNIIKHLVFSLDGTTRYIPMGALIAPNKKYLIESYTVSTVLNATETQPNPSDSLPRSVQATSVLALGTIDTYPPFMALPNVKQELAAIVRSPDDSNGIYPGLKILGFSSKDLTRNLANKNILHIATHAKFLPTDINKSYLLLGDGHYFFLSQFNNIHELSSVQLVVLSACETAVNSNLNGKELSGINSFFIGGPSKAKAIIGTLWQVDDISTSKFMQDFYQYLSTGKYTKADAIQKSQLNMIKKLGSSDFSHPYYWAPFILTGNWL